MAKIDCWQCGVALEVILPLSRRESCSACERDLHCCKLCQHYAPGLAGSCNEERAEAVTDKETANFCDYFSPKANAYRPQQTGDTAAAHAQLAKLFGEQDVGTPSEPEFGEDAAAAARAELERLFGGGDRSS